MAFFIVTPQHRLRGSKLRKGGDGLCLSPRTASGRGFLIENHPLSQSDASMSVVLTQIKVTPSSIIRSGNHSLLRAVHRAVTPDREAAASGEGHPFL